MSITSSIVEFDLPAYNVDTELPTYREVFGAPGWNFIIRNSVTGAGFNIFLSKKAYHQYLKINQNETDDARDMHIQGIGIPMFRVTGSLSAINPKPMIIKKYVANTERPFNAYKDYQQFCTVKKKVHSVYTSYTFKFTPDIEDPSQDFEVVMFSHITLPISDYIYRGEKHRWIHEDTKQTHQYRHTILESSQESLADGWDGQSDKLKRVWTTRRFVQNASFIHTFGRMHKLPTDEYYGSGCSSILNMTSVNTISGYAELRARDEQEGSLRDYDEISEVPLDHMVQICIATVLKTAKV
ncbi:uncharacterized protein SPAPADRAFT_58733 [Spathaspora passalidarum NRRL Y-27907]|uniref:Uncharacterized protein n=1 Tax=Spathaspora passalidarum (strain NRRL Y-27907 / 11-Y1) TaxID=619300 RepID=G3AH61_SPAPN|nr:uncharacterized protein SPAPADRAFT_58733 [Spathaspora passalidarum NRRL Y-27907]EGW35491.1 hypothetical protein SPAPADRAFT_58733 [Spathaspora passalidarum NRRL Y-27907]